MSSPSSLPFPPSMTPSPTLLNTVPSPLTSPALPPTTISTSVSPTPRPLFSPPSPNTLLTPSSPPPLISPPAVPFPSPLSQISQPPPLQSVHLPPPFSSPSPPAPQTLRVPSPPRTPVLPFTLPPLPAISIKPTSPPLPFTAVTSPAPPTPPSQPITPPSPPTTPFPTTGPPPLPFHDFFPNPPPLSSSLPSTSSSAPPTQSPFLGSTNSPILPSPPSTSPHLPISGVVQKLPYYNMPVGLIVGLLVGGAVLLVLILGLLFVFRRYGGRKKYDPRKDFSKENDGVATEGTHVLRMPSNSTVPPSPLLMQGSGDSSGSKCSVPHLLHSVALGSSAGIFTYNELMVATNGFSEDNILGQGGFGYVFRGVLPNGKQVAVKQLKTGSQQGEREFQAEVETISRVHHKHLVSLVGYCTTRAEKLLVYEFVPNNTLEFHLHGKEQPIMEWATRMKIALGSAKGLSYLHEDCNPTIIHRDIKASNILLDFKFDAKVSDFGLAKFFTDYTNSPVTHITTRVVGTFGYLAPEYASSGKLTDKSDVYSYGVMLLELITGHPPILTTESLMNQSLVDWARPLLTQALKDDNFNTIADPRLNKKYRSDEMARMVACAAACVRHSTRLRPRMRQIVGALEGLISVGDLDDGTRPGYSPVHNWLGSEESYDAKQYQEDMRNFNQALAKE